MSQAVTSSVRPSASGPRAATTDAAQPTAPPTASSNRPSYKPCAPAALAVAPGPLLSPATGEHGDIYTVRNVGTTTCTVSGYPEVALTAGTTVLGFRYVDGAGQYVTHRPPGLVTLPPGVNAYFLIAKYRCDAHTTAIATTAQIRLPGQRTTHVLAIQTTSTEHGAAVLAYCTGNGEPDPGDTVAISPIADSIQRAVEN